MENIKCEREENQPFSKILVRTFLLKESVEGHLWKDKWKEKPNDEGHRKLTMNS